MGYTSTTTAKITADTSEVQKAIKSLKDELKSMGKSMTIDDVKAKFKTITDSAAPAGAKLQELKKLAKEIEFNGFDDQGLINQVAESISKATAESNLMRDAIKNAQAEMQKVGDNKNSFAEVKESIKKTAEEIKGLENREKELKKVQEEYLKQKVDKQSPEWKALQAEIKKTEQAIKKAKGEQISFVNVDFKNLKGSLDNITNSLGALGGKASGVGSVLGKIGPAIANPYVAAGAAVVGLGAAFYNYNKNLDETLQKTEQFTGLTGNSLLSLRNGIKACADSWNKDYDTVLSGVDGLMAQFGISGEQALSIISKGFTAGADDAGKMLDMMKKYSGAFKDMGISAEEMTALISQTKSGIFSEEGMDLIQKAGQKLREFNSKTAESLANIGINTEDMFKRMQTGELRTIDAVKMVSERLKDVGYQSKEAGDVLRDVFGKQGAKAGLELVTALSEVETSLEACVDATDEMHKANKALEDAQRDLENAMSSMFGVANGGFATMVTKIKTEVIRSVVELMNRIIDLYNESIAFRGAIQMVIFAFKALGDVCKSVMSMMLDQWKALGDVIDGVMTGDFKKAAKGVGDFYDSFKKASKSAIDGIIKDFNVMVDNVQNSRIEKVEIPAEVKTENTGTTGGGEYTGSGSGTGKSGKSKKDKSEKIDYLVAVDDQSLQMAQKKLAAWEDKLKNLPVTATAEIEEAKSEIERWKAEVERREFLLTGKLNEGPLQKIQKKIAELKEIQSRIDPELDEERLKEIISQIKEFTEQEENLKIRLGLEIPTGPLQKVQQEIKKLQEEKLRLNPEVDEAKLKEIEQKIDEAVEKERTIKLQLGEISKGDVFSDAQSQLSQLKSDYANKLISKEEAEKKITEINQMLSSIGLQPLELTIDDSKIMTAMEKVEEMKQKIETTSGSVSQMGSAFNNLGSAIGGATGEVMGFIGQSIQGIAQLIPQIASLFVAQQAEAEAGVATGASKLPFPASIIAMAAGIASVVAMFAKMPKFAEGGIVGGSSYTGDKIIARLNSGEGVLTKEGVNNLHALAGTANELKGSVKFEIDGKTIKGVLDNTNKSISKYKK